MNVPKVLDGLKPAHIACAKEDIASIVIMPGDPLRAKYIAENFLDDYKLVSDVRNMYAFTGFYKNKRVTVMGSGMGMPSISIYAFELYYFFGVEKIIRIGTCGGSLEEMEIGDLVLANEAYNEGSFAYSYNGENTHLVNSSKELTSKIRDVAKNKNIKYFEGTVMTSEQFTLYADYEHILNRVPGNIRIIAEEMEAFALFHTANSFEKEAACMLTVVDSKFKENQMSIEDRQLALNNMITIALDSIISD